MGLMDGKVAIIKHYFSLAEHVMSFFIEKNMKYMAEKIMAD